MWQTVSLAGYVDSSLIDNQTVRFNLSAWLGGFSTHNDAAEVALTFTDQNNQSIGSSLSIGPVTNVDRGGVTSFLYRETTGAVLAGTRSITVSLIITRAVGAISDGYADSIRFFLYQ